MIILLSVYSGCPETSSSLPMIGWHNNAGIAARAGAADAYRGAPTRGNKGDPIIEAATEIGAMLFAPMAAEHSLARVSESFQMHPPTRRPLRSWWTGPRS